VTGCVIGCSGHKNVLLIIHFIIDDAFFAEEGCRIYSSAFSQQSKWKCGSNWFFWPIFGMFHSEISQRVS